MQIGKTFYPKNRQEWRKWLEKNYAKEREIWLVSYRKATQRTSIPYNDAVEEALCFGWIDSIVKGIDAERLAQRYTPRKPKSNWSGMNIERIRRLIENGKMTGAGLRYFDKKLLEDYKIPNDILRELKKDRETWKNFQKFSETYKRIRVKWIDDVRIRPEEFKKRLNHFLKMTKQNKMFGMVR